MNAAAEAPTSIAHDQQESSTDRAMYARITWRLMPPLLFAYMVAFLDRINVGYAQLQMKESLAFSDTVYGLGAGVFFIGYLLFEVPSNLALEKIGARKTLLRIMFCWGLVAASMMFVQTPTQFYVLRFLLGAFEAGFSPGVLLYLTYWYPRARRGQMMALFLTGAVAASVIAGPLSGGIMKWMNGANGWHGWQWLFLLQGLPATVLGIVLYFVLHDRPEHAPWLSATEKARVRSQLEHEPHPAGGSAHGFPWRMLRDHRVWLLSLIYFMLVAGTYAITFWLPTLIRSWGIADLFMIGIYAALPNVFGVVGMVLMGRSSDRHKERRWHIMAAALIAATGLGITTVTQGNFAASLAAMCLAVIGVTSIVPIFFALTSEYLPRHAVAGGIALVSSLGNLGGAASPSVTGAINAATGGQVWSMYLVMALYVLSGLVLLVTVRPARGDARRPTPLR